MTHPIWILNSSLLFLSLILTAFLYFLHTPIPEREQLEPLRFAQKTTKKVVSQVNIRKIYEHDLFNTYSNTAEKNYEQLITQAPPPPAPAPIKIPEIPEVFFLDPLDITLKGIITFVATPEKNRIIIENNKTKEEQTLRLNDSIEDAKIMRILPNKVIFVRSNGQQEILYVRELDANIDPTFTTLVQWEDIIKQTGNFRYTIYAHSFIERINNLSQFIDMLGVTTAYKKGVSIGCKIGAMDKQSFGPKVGLMENDIITKINGKSIATTEDRINMYKTISVLPIPTTISVDIIRNNAPQTIMYTVTDTIRIPRKSISSEATPSNLDTSSMSSSAKEFQKKEKAIMLQQGTTIDQKRSLSNQETTEQQL